MRKNARIFVCGHCYLDLFRGSEQFSESVARGTDNVQGQICENISISNGGYFVYYPSNFFATRVVLKTGEYHGTRLLNIMLAFFRAF